MPELHTMEKVFKEGMLEVTRLQVPNGWLYITHNYGSSGGVDTCFVEESELASEEQYICRMADDLYHYQNDDGHWNQTGYTLWSSCKLAWYKRND